MAKAKGKARASKAKARARTAPRAVPPAGQEELRALVADLALLTAANNLMAQNAFLTVERLRISNEVVDEAVSNEFGAQLYERCEQLARASDDTILKLLERVGGDDARADTVRAFVGMRREFATRARKPTEQKRLLESLERMYR